MNNIICSAIHFNDGKTHVHQPNNITSGFIVTGRRHCNCFATIISLGTHKNNIDIIERQTQGFLTSNNLFLNREEAYEFALESKQIKDDGRTKKRLFSEDLY